MEQQQHTFSHDGLLVQITGPHQIGGQWDISISIETLYGESKEEIHAHIEKHIE